MGSRERSRERRRSRSRSSSSDSSRSEERRHKHKKHKEKKHKHKHKKHKRHHSDADDERVRAAKAFLEQHLKAGGDPAAAGGKERSGKERSGRDRPPPEKTPGMLPPGAPLITSEARRGAAQRGARRARGGPACAASGVPRRARRARRAPQDYFSRSAEFTAWLQEIRHTFFNELTSEQSHALFAEFVRDWNSGDVPLRFYGGLATAPVKRTAHDWGIKAAPGGVRAGMAAFNDDAGQQQAEQRAAARVGDAAERRSWRREQKEALDELLPKATGGTHEGRVEARMARREEARARDASPDLVPLAGGGDVMGGGDSFAAAKAREAKRVEWRDRKFAAKREEIAAKLSAAAAAEAEKMAAFRALVANQGGRMVIPKRQ
ncbi:SCI1 [Scenedesmus sp. PABB004]|nr:SCI1 [Scenedesmus sp. PABB004]